MNNNTLKFKTLALLMSLALVFTSFSAVFAADTTVSASAETVSADIINAMEMLAAIGIIEVGDSGLADFPANEQITRGEFASYLYNMLNLSVSAIEPMAFNDVAKTHPYAKHIGTLAVLGHLNGDGNGIFNPDDKVDYAQVVKGIVSVLGYNDFAQLKGGYPVGYFLQATELGFLGNRASNEATITRGEICLLIANAAQVDINVAVDFGDGTRYETVDGRNYLSHYWGYERVEGILTATDKSFINTQSGAKKSTLHIDGVKYEYDNAVIDPYDFLGEEVVGYYKNEAVKTLISLTLTTKPYDYIVLDGEQIVGFDENTHEISYYDEEGLKIFEETISPAAKVIYNGRYAEQYTREMLTQVNGTLKLIMTGSNGYDIIKINDYDTYVVSSVVPSASEIYNYYNAADVIKADVEDKEMFVTITKDGKAITLADIAPWDVIDVARSVDNKVVDIEVYTNAVTGKVTAIANESGDTFITVDGVQYEILKANAADFRKRFSVGTTATFHIGKNNVIAGWSNVTASDNLVFGLLVKAGTSAEDIDGSLLVMIYNTNKEMATYSTASKLRINGTVQNNTAALSLLMPKGVNADNRQVIRYKLNSDGKISHIELADVYKDTRLNQKINDSAYAYLQGIKNIDQLVINDDQEHFVAIDLGNVYSAESTPVTSFGGIYFPHADNTSFFQIPNDVDEFESYNILSTKWGYWQYNKDTVLYTTKPGDMYFDAAIIKYNKDDTGEANRIREGLLIVTEIARILDEEGTERTVINALKAGSEVSLIVADRAEEVANTLVKGDIFSYGTDGYGRVGDVIKYFDASKMTATSAVSYGYQGTYDTNETRIYNHSNLMIMGYAYDHKDNILSLIPSTSTVPPQYDDFQTLASIAGSSDDDLTDATDVKGVNPQKVLYHLDYSSATEILRYVITKDDIKVITEEGVGFTTIRSKAANPTRVFVYAKSGKPSMLVIIDDQR